MPEITDYLKVLVSLIIVLSFIYVLYYYMNNYLHLLKRKDGKIKIIESYPLGKNKSLFLIEIEGERMLLSSDDKGMKLLKEWKKEEE